MAENTNSGCSQRDSAEHEGYAKASRSFNRIWKERDSAQPKLLEAILYKDNLNRAYKRVKANKGAPGIDGITMEEALPYLKEHQQEFKEFVRPKSIKERMEDKQKTVKTQKQEQKMKPVQRRKGYCNISERKKRFYVFSVGR